MCDGNKELDWVGLTVMYYFWYFISEFITEYAGADRRSVIMPSQPLSMENIFKPRIVQCSGYRILTPNYKNISNTDDL